MKHGIKSDGDIVAKFEHDSDRDICIKALRKVYTDCEFETVNNVDEETAEETAKEQTDESVN